jgi:hypothetical protein
VRAASLGGLDSLKRADASMLGKIDNHLAASIDSIWAMAALTPLTRGAS